MHAAAAARRRRTRSVLALGVAVGLFVPVYFALLADTTPLAWDFRAYRHAAVLAAAGDPFVGAWAPVGHGQWVYPPVVVLGFLPYAALPVWPAFVVQVGVGVAASLVVAGVTVTAIERETGRLPCRDRAAVTAFFLASTYSAAVFGQGQVDPVVVLALAAAVCWVHTGRSTAAGVAAGAAALVKLFPVVVGVYFLRVRAYRAVAAATATGVAGLAVGVFAFGVDAHRRYLHLILHERSRLDAFVGGADPDLSALSLARPLGAFAPDLDPALYPLVALAALAPVAALAYVDVTTVADRAAALLATVGVALLVSPGSNAHHVFYLYPPLVVLLYAADGLPHRLLVAGTAVLLCPVQPQVVADVLAVGGASPAVRAALVAPLADALSAVSVPLVGVLVLLAGCAAHALGRRPGAAPTTTFGD
ncbi:MAG: glycosyltransferase family 87 protein [Halobacterium sp.]